MYILLPISKRIKLQKLCESKLSMHNEMTERNVKCFITIVGLYFITKDVGALVLYSRRKTHTEYPKKQESKEN